MKILTKKLGDLALAGRWDIDFHLPPEGIKKFPKTLLKRVDEVASISKVKRDSSKKPEELFQYIDITGVDVSTGVIVRPQDLTGEEAPSRARKVICAYDVIVSTCRPTRGAIAVVPQSLHNQIASTAFSIVRAKPGVNPFYLHYALRLSSTLEQFRKWSTGSSYPAILDEDVKKTLIPMPGPEMQDRIARSVLAALKERDAVVDTANAAWNGALDSVTSLLLNGASSGGQNDAIFTEAACTIAEIQAAITELPPLENDLGPIEKPLLAQE
jgi:type I restriction enzyme S subunit